MVPFINVLAAWKWREPSIPTKTKAERNVQARAEKNTVNFAAPGAAVPAGRLILEFPHSATCADKNRQDGTAASLAATAAFH